MKLRLALFFSFFIVFLGVYSYALWIFFQSTSTHSEVHDNSGKYTFINPLLECNATYNYFNPNPTIKVVNEYIEESKQIGDIYEVAYYVRLLNNGSHFGYNQHTKFIPASLVKLPLAMSLLNQLSTGEINKKLLTTIQPEDTTSGDEVPDTIKVGREYSIYELMSEMLINSDNTAAYNLLEYLHQSKGTQTYESLGLGLVDFSSENSLNLSVESYASFFRVLYNASFLSRKDSEIILSLLGQSSFHSGIRAFLPPDLLIANKFGSREFESGENHLHDCGIIYTENPYVVCIMTRGKNREAQRSVIQQISKMVYDNLQQQ